eukprot:Sspe_Gene.5791::Locus_1923_Transcript_1_1_Confidence_1.000_Length_899::g.5791::m.5791
MPPKGARKGVHHNTTTWIPHKHQEGLRVTDAQCEGFTSRCCPKCTQVLEWRKKYGKYKPLSKPSKCHTCAERVVLHAHHGICQPCAKKRDVCAKCEKPIVAEENDDDEELEAQLREKIPDLPERYKRTAERLLEKGASLQEVNEAVERGLQKKEGKKHEVGPRGSEGGRKETAPREADDSDSDEVI